MEISEKFARGSFVKIIKDGSHGKVPYKKGEIWQVQTYSHGVFYDLVKDEKTVRVSVSPGGRYGVECEAYEVKNTYEIY